MKLEIARGLFFLGGLAIATAAAAAWEEPGPGILSATAHCPAPHVVKAKVVATPDQDLLLLLFGLRQGLRPQS